MRSSFLVFSVFFLLLLGFALIVTGHHGYWGLLHLVLCLCAAIIILYVSRARAEYLWLGTLGGIALMFAPLNPAVVGTGPFWPDVICVAVFVGYYKLFIARNRTPGSRSSRGSGYRAR